VSVVLENQRYFEEHRVVGREVADTPCKETSDFHETRATGPSQTPEKLFEVEISERIRPEFPGAHKFSLSQDETAGVCQ